MSRQLNSPAVMPLVVRIMMMAAAAAAVAGAADVAAQNGGPLGSPIPGAPLGQPVKEAGAEAFLAHQLGFPRVAAARESADGRLRFAFAEAGVPYPASEIFLRVFKHERVLELWARSHPDADFTRIRSYPVCSLPGQLGPKRQMGDVQVPEGFYFIDQFNPRSEFHLSLRVNYPNMADRMRREALALGGDIFIHGGCATIGCVPIEDHNIEEVYWAAIQATDAGQRLIPVHIFPARLDADNLRWLQATFSPEPDLLAFWQNLAQGYAYFEATRQVPWVTVAASGDYTVPERPVLAGDGLSPGAVSSDSTGLTGPVDTLPPPGDSLRAPEPRPAGGTGGGGSGESG